MRIWPTFVALGLGSFIGRMYVNSLGLTSFWEETLIQGAAIMGAVFLVNFIPTFISALRKPVTDEPEGHAEDAEAAGGKEAMKSDPDEAVIQELKRAGSNVNKPTSIRFYVYMPDEAKARLVAQRATKDGDNVEVRLGADDTNWLCLITRTMIPEAAALRTMRRKLTALATELGGEYDGWEAAVVRQFSRWFVKGIITAKPLFRLTFRDPPRRVPTQRGRTLQSGFVGLAVAAGGGQARGRTIRHVSQPRCGRVGAVGFAGKHRPAKRAERNSVKPNGAIHDARSGRAIRNFRASFGGACRDGGRWDKQLRASAAEGASGVRFPAREAGRCLPADHHGDRREPIEPSISTALNCWKPTRFLGSPQTV